MSAYVARRAKPYLPERHSYSKGRAMTDGMTHIPHRFRDSRWRVPEIKRGFAQIIGKTFKAGRKLC
jgi:hypothetical protein